MLADLGDLLVNFFIALGTLIYVPLAFVGQLAMSDLALPFGLGHLPVWGCLLGVVILGWGSAWILDRPMSERLNLVVALVTVAGLGFGVWQWRSQVDRDEMRRHADFVGRVSVITYSLPEGMQVMVRNANSATARVLFLSLSPAGQVPENWEIIVEPCTQRTFTVSPRTTWGSIVRKGGHDWLPGSDPVVASDETIFGTYGVKDANGAEQIHYVGAATHSAPVSDCAA
ncbi:hypothetical protein ACFWYW_48815 [Nonomuraea sp. NPDC059023]|uniref:hypothetical protein n=1 Tax=unclassified Nonomuraea TaxID=2593643 RepID=UPI0036868C49